MGRFVFSRHCRGGLAIAVPAIVLLAIAIRAPFFNYAGTDEAFFLVAGRQWLQGLPPYAGTADVKPPLLFLLMSGAAALPVPPFWAVKTVATAAAALTACGLYLFGRRLAGGLAGGVAAIFYLAASLDLGGALSPAEIFMAPFTTFGMLIGLPAALDGTRLRIQPILISGLLFGAAACIKQSAGFEAMALALALLWNRTGAARVRAFAVFAAGVSIVPLAFLAYFAAIGSAGSLIELTVFAAITRAAAAYNSWREAFWQVCIELIFILPVAAMAAALVRWPHVLRSRPAYPEVRFLAVWAAAAFAGLLAARAMLGFYALPLLQPLCLAAGLFVDWVPGRVQHLGLRWYWRGLALTLSFGYLAFPALAVYSFKGDAWAAFASAAEAMRQAKQEPSDRLFVADRDVMLYIAAGKDPAHRIFLPMHLFCDFPLPGADRALQETLDSEPGFITVADPPMHLECERPERRALLYARLARDYCRLGRFSSIRAGGQAGPFILYRRKPPSDGAGPCR